MNILQNKSRIQTSIVVRPTLATLFILMIPFLARFPWDETDYLIMGVLIFGAGLIGEFAARSITNPKYRVIALLALLFAFMLIWAELAVGLFGSPFAGN